jgi:hypothetical protein
LFSCLRPLHTTAELQLWYLHYRKCLFSFRTNTCNSTIGAGKSSVLYGITTHNSSIAIVVLAVWVRGPTARNRNITAVVLVVQNSRIAAVVWYLQYSCMGTLHRTAEEQLWYLQFCCVGPLHTTAAWQIWHLQYSCMGPLHSSAEQQLWYLQYSCVEPTTRNCRITAVVSAV